MDLHDYKDVAENSDRYRDVMYSEHDNYEGFQDFYLDLARQYGSGGTVDIACGTGAVLLHLAEAGIDIDGTDLSEVRKNNGVMKDVLYIRKEDCECIPCFYMDELYHSYCNGENEIGLAEHLANIVGAFPETKFDLLHGGDPFFGTMALMGNAFPNVYVNMSSIPCHSTANFEHWLDIYLDRVPTSKLTIGWDLFTPEILCGASSAIRDSIARVFAKKVDAGLYCEELALEFAKDIMYRSAEKLFGR